jgi:hypothetical protein
MAGLVIASLLGSTAVAIGEHMDDQQKQGDDRADVRRADDRERTTTNIVLLLIFAGLVGVGVWLSSAMLDARRADECISSGRRNCSPIDVPPR